MAETTHDDSSSSPSSPSTGGDLLSSIQKQGYGVDSDRILAELKIQSAEREDEVDFALEMINQSNPWVFVFMKRNSPHLYFYHSVGKFVNLMNQSEYKDSVIGFAGNRADGVEPVPIEAGEDMWIWKKFSHATEIIKITTFGEKEENSGKLYKAESSDAKQTVSIPPTLLSPSGLVGWLLEKRRTPMDLHQKMMSLITGDNIPDYLNVSLNWALAAAQCAPDSEDELSSMLALAPTPILTQDPTTIKWIKARLDTTLGPPRNEIPHPSHHPKLFTYPRNSNNLRHKHLQLRVRLNSILNTNERHL